MSVKITPEPLDPAIAIPDWEPPLPPTDLIFDDGEPLETNRHRIAMNLLIRSVQHTLGNAPLQTLRDPSDFFVGGNMFVYYSRDQAMNRDFRGPDFFAVLNVNSNRERQGWVIWEEDGRYPDVIIELLSASTAAVDKGVKKHLYEQTFRTPDYFIFNPFEPDSLQGWHLTPGQSYEPLAPDQRGWLWCETLQLWLGTWKGVIDREPAQGTCTWLRFYQPDGSLALLPEEAATQRAEQEQQRAEQEQQRAEQEQQRAEQEQQRAEQAERQLNELVVRLRQRGIDPDTL
jgi:Uma2 family endonuclease